MLASVVVQRQVSMAISCCFPEIAALIANVDDGMVMAGFAYCCGTVDSDPACRCNDRCPWSLVLPFMPRSSSTMVVWLVLLVSMHLALCWLFPLCSVDCRQAQGFLLMGTFGRIHAFLRDGDLGS